MSPREILVNLAVARICMFSDAPPTRQMAYDYVHICLAEIEGTLKRLERQFKPAYSEIEDALEVYRAWVLAMQSEKQEMLDEILTCASARYAIEALDIRPAAVA